jgi:hypothetical protein
MSRRGQARSRQHCYNPATMSRTFTVSKVAPATQRRPALDRTRVLPDLVRHRVEQMWASDAHLVSCTDVHPLVQMAHDAFYEHRPIALSPDAIWFCIAQGFAQHVNLNVERLRSRFVKHEGKVKLLVERLDFVIGQPNPWPEAFAVFSDQIASHVGKLRDLVVADFSTTGPIERAASEVVLMDAFQGYFEYEMLCGCGIPEITLLGTPADWRSVRQRAAMLGELDLEPWTRALLPVLDRIVRTAEGHDDPAFWQSFFHYESGSRGCELTGWIHVLFPYLKHWQTGELAPNPHLGEWEREHHVATTTDWRRKHMNGPSLTAIPSGLASAPVKVTDLRKRDVHMMRFIAGMFGVVESSAGVLTPEFGWAIVYDPPA